MHGTNQKMKVNHGRANPPGPTRRVMKDKTRKAPKQADPNATSGETWEYAQWAIHVLSRVIIYQRHKASEKEDQEKEE